MFESTCQAMPQDIHSTLTRMTVAADASLGNDNERRLADEALRMSRQETDLIRDFQEEYGRTNAQVEGEREQWQEVLELSVVRRVVTPMFERNVYDMV